MARVDNRQAHKIAVQNGWYSRFNETLRECVSCDAEQPDAHVDIVRAYDYLREGVDRGPVTPETIRARFKREQAISTAGIQGING